jgi:hypothetical protein
MIKHQIAYKMPVPLYIIIQKREGGAQTIEETSLHNE